MTELDISNNDLTSIPEWLAQLGDLKVLALNGSNLTVVPECLRVLKKLEILILGDNLLTSLPQWFPLPKLRALDMKANRFTEIPEVIYDIASLDYIRFENYPGLYRNQNEIREISPKFLELKRLERFHIGDNPLESPPLEVVKQGIDAIRQYFQQLEAAGTDRLYEAKLIIIGEGSAEKTFPLFARKIENPDYSLRVEDSTKGIEVISVVIPDAGRADIPGEHLGLRGAGIYHATHQFFLTKRSVYVLVADTRKEDTDFYYWLNAVELLSDGSPILIVKNEKQNRTAKSTSKQLRGQFGNLKETLATNLADNRGLDKILSEVKHYLCGLPHVGSPLPKTWVKVREAWSETRETTSVSKSTSTSASGTGSRGRRTSCS